MAITIHAKQVEEYLTLAYSKEKETFNSLDSFELRNGYKLSTIGLKELFSEIHKKMVESESFIFNEDGIFKNLIENHGLYDAASYLLYIIDHLDAICIANLSMLPVAVTIKTDYHAIDRRSEITQIGGGFYIVYYFNGHIANVGSIVNGLDDGIYECYNNDGSLSFTSVYISGRRTYKSK